MRAPTYIGPLIPSQLWPLRYGAAVVVVAITVALRASLSPLLGTQSPLLPFVLSVFVCAYLGGRGAGLLATVLTPVAATLWFTAWPHDAPPLQWGAHVLFFLLIAALATLLMHELQRSSLAQMLALNAAAESDRRQRERAAQLRLITDAMPALISYIAPDFTYRFGNRQYESWFGRPAEQVVGLHMREVLGNDAFEMIRPRLERALRGNRVFFEQSIPYANGPREVSVHYIPDIGMDGVVHGCFALIEDVSARKRAERVLREADRRKDDFLAVLGHELRNPLASIRNVAHILGHSGVDAETVKRSSELLGRQASHLTQLVDDLLDVGRITRGRIPLDRRPLLLALVVDHAIEAVRALLEAKRQAVTVRGGDAALAVNADPVRLGQVVVNLLGNAIKFSPDGARIEVTLGTQAEHAVISVLDPGVGIDPQMLPSIFDQFRQGDRPLDRAEGGLGVGLAVVKHLVEMHGGRVEAQSAGLGEGSEFRVFLQRVAMPLEVQKGKSGHSTPARVRRRVLVVDDNRDAAESLREVLRLSGHEVEVVRDGAAALIKLDEFRADVVLLDIALPRMDGYMVAHAIRARFSHSLRRPRLLALTGFAREEDRHSALRSGFDGHLVKPVEPAHLLRMIADEGLLQTSVSEFG